MNSSTDNSPASKIKPPLATSTTPLTFLTLPTELLTQIFSLLPGHTLKLLRLVSRHLSRISTPILLHTTPLLFTTRSLDRLLSLAQTPHLASHIRVLEYNTMVLNERGAYASFKEWRESLGAMRPLYPIKGTGRTRIPGGKERGDEAEVKKLPVVGSPRFFTRQRMSWERWEGIFEEQMLLLQDDIEVERLVEALRELKGLREIRMKADVQGLVDYYDCVWRGDRWVVLWDRDRYWLEGERRKFLDGGGGRRRREKLEEAIEKVVREIKVVNFDDIVKTERSNTGSDKETEI